MNLSKRRIRRQFLRVILALRPAICNMWSDTKHFHRLLYVKYTTFPLYMYLLVMLSIWKTSRLLNLFNHTKWTERFSSNAQSPLYYYVWWWCLLINIKVFMLYVLSYLEENMNCGVLQASLVFHTCFSLQGKDVTLHGGWGGICTWTTLKQVAVNVRSVHTKMLMRVWLTASQLDRKVWKENDGLIFLFCLRPNTADLICSSSLKTPINYI